MTSFTRFETGQVRADGQRGERSILAADRLQAARRIDWRFLLPDPRLGKVACLAPADGPLLASLRLFSHSVELIEAIDGVPDEYDLVVSSSLNDRQLIAAAQLIRPGGYLYGEAPGLTARLWSRIRGMDWQPGPSSHPADHLALASALGLTNLKTYWLWPDFVNTSQIIPLDSEPALQLALFRVGRGRRGRVQRMGGSLLLKSGLLKRLIPCFSLVAQKPGENETT